MSGSNWWEDEGSEPPTPTTQTQGGGGHAEEVKTSHTARVAEANVVRFYSPEGAHAIARTYINGYHLNGLGDEIGVYSAQAVVTIRGQNLAGLWEALTQETIDAVHIGEVVQGSIVEAIKIYRAGEKPPEFNP